MLAEKIWQCMECGERFATYEERDEHPATPAAAPNPVARVLAYERMGAPVVVALSDDTRSAGYVTSWDESFVRIEWNGQTDVVRWGHIVDVGTFNA